MTNVKVDVSRWLEQVIADIKKNWNEQSIVGYDYEYFTGPSADEFDTRLRFGLFITKNYEKAEQKWTMTFILPFDATKEVAHANDRQQIWNWIEEIQRKYC